MGGLDSQDVIVLDAQKKFLEYTTHGKARLLLKGKEARIYSRSPFAIILMRQMSVASMRRKSNMVAPRNFTDYFKEEKDVYVQNIADAQVSVDFPLGHGRTEGFLFAHNRDPLNLSQYIPFQAIKDSMDFRKMLSRRPPALQLLSKEEYESYFKKKASTMGLHTQEGKPDVDAAIDASEERRRRTADKNLRETVTDKDPEPIHEVVEKGSGPGGMPMFGERQRVAAKEMVSEDDVINPRILHLCNQVKAEIPEEERMPAKDLLDALQDVTNLKIDDYEHVRSHGFYKSVKKWAKQEMSKLATETERDDKEEAEDSASEE